LNCQLHFHPSNGSYISRRCTSKAKWFLSFFLFWIWMSVLSFLFSLISHVYVSFFFLFPSFRKSTGLVQ
jgi:hypothetical protein